MFPERTGHVVCPYCSAWRTFDRPIKCGKTLKCHQCCQNFAAGHWHGNFWENIFMRALNDPLCPMCNARDSIQGMVHQPVLSFMQYRQCKHCHTVWHTKKFQ